MSAQSMTRVDRLAEGFKSIDSFDEPASSLVMDQLPDFLTYAPVKSGQIVNYRTALQVATVLACVRVLAESIAQCPVKVLRPIGGGAEPAVDVSLYRLLSLQPNTYQTAFEFWETMIAHLCLVGNAFAIKLRGVNGDVVGLVPVAPGQVTVTQHGDLSLSYVVTMPDGRVGYFRQDDIWHVKFLSWNTWLGMEPVRLARECLGLTMALEESHSRMHANGVKPSGIYSVEGKLTEDQHNDLTQWLTKAASGANASSPLILDMGAKWLTQQMSGVDAQHIESRRLQVEETCRWMRVMPIMVGATDAKTPAAGAEQNFLAHVTYSVAPLAVRLEQSAAVHLLNRPAEMRQGLYVKFFLQGLMRGDYKSRQEGLQIQRRNGVINANEWRGLEEMNRRTDPGGDQYIVEGNMTPQDGPSGFVAPLKITDAQGGASPNPTDPAALPPA